MEKTILKYTLAIAAMLLMLSCEKTSVEEYAQYMGWEIIDSDNDNQNSSTDKKPTSHGEVIETGVVDLGLSVKWAACNLSKTTENHFVQNCTDKGSDFSWSTGGIEYPPASISGTEYDNATDILGKGWRTPTTDEFQELRDKCYITYTSFRGIDGIKVTGPSGKTMFLPYNYNYDYWTGNYDLTEGRPYCIALNKYASDSRRFMLLTTTYSSNSGYIRAVCDK